MSSTKRKLDAPEEDSLSRKRTPLDLNSRSLVDSTNDIGVPRTHFEAQVWMVQWYNHINFSAAFTPNRVRHSYRRNPQYRKHKTWDGDGILTVNETSEALLYNSDSQM
jgi:hypothetical protein